MAGEKRAELMAMLEDTGDQQTAKVLEKQSPATIAWGKLVGALVEKGFGKAQVEDIFTSWENEYGEGRPLDNREKMTAFMHAIGVLGCTDAQYRDIRQIFITANQKSR